MSLNKYSEAIDNFNHYLKYFPNDVYAWNSMQKINDSMFSNSLETMLTLDEP